MGSSRPTAMSESDRWAPLRADVPDWETLSPAQKIVSLILAISGRHGYPGRSFESFLDWLDQRREGGDQAVLKEAQLEPMAEYGASRADTRPAGKFVGRLRQGQERRAQQAMLIMANDLQRAYRRIEQLEEQGQAQRVRINDLRAALAGYQAGGHPVTSEEARAGLIGEGEKTDV
jgi:hypothetical protein